MKLRPRLHISVPTPWLIMSSLSTAGCFRNLKDQNRLSSCNLSRVPSHWLHVNLLAFESMRILCVSTLQPLSNLVAWNLGFGVGQVEPFFGWFQTVERPFSNNYTSFKSFTPKLHCKMISSIPAQCPYNPMPICQDVVCPLYGEMKRKDVEFRWWMGI